MPYCPTAMTTARQLHVPQALSTSHRSQKQNLDEAFARRLATAGFELEVRRLGKPRRHVVYLARRR